MSVARFGRWAGLMVGAAAVALLVVGCSGAAPSPTPAGAASVDITLQEWAIVPSTTSVAAGKVTFNAKNVGPKDEHEMVILKTDLPLLGLPTGSDGKADEEGAGITSPGEIEEVSVNGTGSLTVDLTPGRYLLICNVVDADGAHYGKGMATEFTVK